MKNRFWFRIPFYDWDGDFIGFSNLDIEKGIEPYNYGRVYHKEYEQCTGLKDKNGKLIYENDYVKIKDNIYKVFWNKTKISLYNILKKDIMDVDITQNMEVVGNVHETRNFKKV